MKYLMLFCGFFLVIFSQDSCTSSKKSPVLKTYDSAMMEGDKIGFSLHNYRLENGKYPDKLKSLSLDWEPGALNQLKGSPIVWNYSVEDSGSNFHLMTRDRADGYYVSVRPNGIVKASK